MSMLNVALDQKERAAIMVRSMALNLGVDYAIVTEEGYGNPDADYVRCQVILEDAGIPVVGIVDTNCDPDDDDFVIPANDEAIRAVKLITSTMADAIIEAKQGESFADAPEAAPAEAEAEEAAEAEEE